MGKIFLVNRLVSVTLVILVAQSGYLGFVLSCRDVERQALSKFKDSFVGDPAEVLDSWKGMRCCQWDGVTCNNITGYVNRLDFRGFVDHRLYDNSSSWLLTAHKLDPTLVELKHLNHLDLSGADFQGSQIPEFIGSFKHLEYLDLSDANFSAVLPPQLGNLTRLKHLGLCGPEGCYSQYASAPESSQDMNNDVLISNTRNTMQVLTNLPSLTYLQLSSYGLISTPHFYTLLYNSSWMSSIETIDLSYNLLAGPLPNVFGNMSSLEYLDLSNNLLNGSIPLYLRNMRKLEHLYFFSNAFSKVEGGVITGILETPSKLTHLDFSLNLLRGELASPHRNFSKGMTSNLILLRLSKNEIGGNLPFWFGEFKKLVILDLESNRISGTIPASIGNLSALSILSLSNNSLDGAIPEGVGQLNNLYSMDFSLNLLEGVVSESHLANLSDLVELRLSNNRLNLKFNSDWKPPFQVYVLHLSSCRIGGQLPNWIKSHIFIRELDLSNADISGEPLHFLCQFIKLVYVDLHRNKFFGTIPDCFRQGYLLIINLSSNKLSGPIPKSIGLNPSLAFLNLNNNSLEERIPQTFSLLSEMIIMDLGENNLSGGLPDLGPNKLRSIKYMRLRSNKLDGSIPEYLCSLPSIRLLDLSDNKLTGTVPPCIGNLGGMRLSNTPFHHDENKYADYGESIVEVLKEEELQYSGNLQFLVDLDLSCNELVGSIPKSITNLSKASSLNLSHNYLTGNIPHKIGEMRSLESLDLSNNHLNGTIPSSLAALTSLSSLDLSNNQLTGKIPTGNQLQTLNDPSIYAGNPGLCGDPLPNNGQEQESQQPQETDMEDAREKILFCFVIFSGFATGFWGFVVSLLLKRRFRFALFHLASNITDYCYVQTMVRINRLRN